MRKRSGWYLRPLIAPDAALLREWIAGEPDHAGRCTAEAWMAEQKGVQNMLAVDKEGPLLFLRCSNVLRFDLQIGPDRELRAAMALKTGLPEFAANVRRQGYRELIGETSGPHLIRLLRRLGFHESKNEYVLAL